MTPSPTDTARYLEADRPTKLMALALMLAAHTARLDLARPVVPAPSDKKAA